MATEEGKQVQLTDAADLVDQFEELIVAKGISVPRSEKTSADMLSLWSILSRIRSGFPLAPDEMRSEYAAGIAMHDLAAKVLAVGLNPDFPLLVPHLQMLVDGAMHITHEPPADPGAADTDNKLIELYWACVLMESHVAVKLDHPKHPAGNNPDVIALNGNEAARAYAFKTIRSPYTEQLRAHLIKGVDQIEQSDAKGKRQPRPVLRLSAAMRP